MTIKIDKNKEESMQLTLTGMDLFKFREARKRWDFKDEASLVRFMIGLMVFNEDEGFQIKVDGIYKNIAPGPTLLDISTSS